MKSLFLILILIFFSSFISALDLNQTSYSSEDASTAINNTEEILHEFIDLNLPYSSINDSLTEEKSTYLQVYYAEILSGSINVSSEERAIARDALRFVNWKSISYSDVISLYKNVLDTREKTLMLYDLLSIEEKKLSEKISNDTINYFLLARDSFYNGRLNETQTYLDNFRSSYEAEHGSSYLFQSLTLQAKNFFIRHWIQIMLVLIILVFLIYFLYIKIRISLLRKTVQRLHSERNTIDDLMMKAQVERFKEYKISALTYNIRTKSYKERLQKINSDLPVLEARLKKLTKI